MKILESFEEYSNNVMNNPNFKKWFGGSVVSNEDGTPLVVYHGSTRRFDHFDSNMLGSGNDENGIGFYFTSKNRDALGYSEGNEENVINAYLSIKNPLIVPSRDTNFWKVMVLSLDQTTYMIENSPKVDDEYSPYGDWFDSYWENGAEPWMAKKLANEYEGHTSGLYNDIYGDEYAKEFIINLNKITNIDGVKVNSDGAETHWVAFFPTQIKSVDNNGNFNPKDTNIME